MTEPTVSKAKFLATSTVVVSGGGHQQTVEKGKEYVLRKEMFESAIERGMIPQQPLEIQDKSNTREGDTRTVDDKFEVLVERCQHLILLSEAKNFTKTLKPRIGVVREMVDFDFTRQQLYRAYQHAIFRNEQNDSDSKLDTGQTGESDS